MNDIVYELRGLAIGMASPSLARDTVYRAADEIERLRKEIERLVLQVERAPAEAKAIEADIARRKALGEL